MRFATPWEILHFLGGVLEEIIRGIILTDNQEVHWEIKRLRGESIKKLAGELK